MKFVILSRKPIPGFGVNGPILSPATYDIHLVLRWIGAGVDIREVMEDGSYRKLKINDERLMEELNKKIEKQVAKRKAIEKQIEDEMCIRPRGNVQLLPEKNRKKPAVKKVKPEPKQEEIKVEPKPAPAEIKEEKVDLFIDELERPE